ncbi:hypothetical protein BDP81DRAFT_330994 [Colletotrichum phormii]|uniref:Zn(2)-C6 fungal-type domain-containing protein n=1 Tax=Colletotrichum phormii TaxID=359342 RepID=A0AAI9ZG70_9PEZI|nr:uncharacterized protein BDP81DRAFT_330994 [Colletotrichum phormii]KAK1623989.1 hypothetical protein BDP81DRAFT_330994 [Colletotrichum phormii]
MASESSKLPSAPKRRARLQKSCTECQRRKQKCITRQPGAQCVNCSRRFPPVECTIVQLGPCIPKPVYETQVLNFELSTLPSRSGKQTEVTFHGLCATSLLGIASLDLPGRLPVRNRYRGEPKSRCFASHHDHARLGGDCCEDNREEERAVSKGKTRANLFLDGDGDPLAFFHNSIASIGGILTEVTTLHGMPLHEGPRTTELLHFYVQFVAPNMVSIDGQSQPPVFLTEVLPWMLQSPLFPNIGILMSSMTQSLERGVEVAKSPESLALKSWVLSMIADYMRRPFDAIATEMVRCIVNLVVMEWFWGADESMFAHMRGIKRMIKLRKGMRGLGDIVGESILILTDYEIACAFETDLYWLENDPARDEEIPIPTTWPYCYDSPLLASAPRFESIAEKLGICAATAKILDDVRFLTESVTSASASGASKSKIRSTASWLYDKLREKGTAAATGPTQVASSSSEKERILETVRIAAVIYSWSIKSLRQISLFDDAEMLRAAYASLTSVSMTTWKGIPGVFLWVMLVAAPNAAADAKGRFVRRKMAVTGLSIGFEDFALGISYLKAFWGVQRWIAREGGGEGEGEGDGVGEGAGVRRHERLEDKWSFGSWPGVSV